MQRLKSGKKSRRKAGSMVYQKPREKCFKEGSGQLLLLVLVMMNISNILSPCYLSFEISSSV